MKSTKRSRRNKKPARLPWTVVLGETASGIRLAIYSVLAPLPTELWLDFSLFTTQGCNLGLLDGQHWLGSGTGAGLQLVWGQPSRDGLAQASKNWLVGPCPSCLLLILASVGAEDDGVVPLTLARLGDSFYTKEGRSAPCSCQNGVKQPGVQEFC